VRDLTDIQQFIEFAEEELQVQGLSSRSEFRKISSWSSLSALLFISGINEHADVLISSADLASCTTLGDIHSLIVNRIHGIGTN
jgi:acyl carrier protein